MKSFSQVLEDIGALRTDPEFMAILDPMEKRGDQLESYLIRPVQRIPRYVLLLKVRFLLYSPLVVLDARLLRCLIKAHRGALGSGEAYEPGASGFQESLGRN